MGYSISDIKADLEGAIHGTTVNQITNLYGIFNRAARDVLADLDPAETKRFAPFASPLFTNVYDYACPVDLKGDRIIDILPQVNRLPGQVINQTYNQAFDTLKANWFGGSNLVTTVWDTARKFLRVSVAIGAVGLLNDCDSLTNNGTWAVGGTATDLTEDTLNFVQGNGSLKFALSGASGYLENSDMTAVDLSTIEDEGSFFLYAWFPETVVTTSVNLRWGSSATDYWDQTVTTTQEGTAFVNGWNLIKFSWADASSTGSPDASAVNYLRYTVTGSGATFPLRLDVITAQLGQIFNIEYYSKYLFRDVAGAFKEKVTVDSDQINLDVDSYQVYFNRVMYLVAQQLQGVDAAAFDATFFEKEYDRSLQRYKSKYKSEVQKPMSQYYQMNQPGYTQYYGRRIW